MGYTHYPTSNLIMPMVAVRRERRLPPDATNPDVVAVINKRVEAEDVLIRGIRVGRYRMLSLLTGLRVRKPAELKPDWIRVKPGDIVSKGDLLAQRGNGGRVPKMTAAFDCVVTRVEAERIIVQVGTEEVAVLAGLPGTVTGIRDRTIVQVESIGALIQGAWGNGRSAFGFYVEEPAAGLKSLADETLLVSLRGQMIWLNRPITIADLKIAQQQQVSAIIAPGMPATLREAALAAPMAILLTDGFGAERMSEIVYNLIRDNLKRQAAVDAVQPTRDSAMRPELFIQLPAVNAMPPPPLIDQQVVPGMMVRLARAPYAGMLGRVTRIAETPRSLDNGLHLMGAEVTLTNGQVVFAPMANLETVGRAIDNRV
jgi:hypothetical protein